MAPKINDLKGPFEKDLGESVVLECTASGTPPVDVVWKREGKSDERQQVWTVLCFCFKALHPRVVGARILQSLWVCPSFLPSLCFNNLSRINWFYMMQVNVITWASGFLFGWAFWALITSLFCTRNMANACLVCLLRDTSRGITFMCSPFFCGLKLW